MTKAKLKFLSRFSPFSNGVPSDNIFRSFFRSIDVEQFKEMFRDWVPILARIVDAKVISIDGKSSRRSYDGDNSMLHMVSTHGGSCLEAAKKDGFKFDEELLEADSD